MKTKCTILSLLILLFLAGCEKSYDVYPFVDDAGVNDEDTFTTGSLPDGFFEVKFFASSSGLQTKAPVTGLDTRVQHILCLIYKSTGEFVKQKNIWLPSQGTPSWPLPVIRDTLPDGEYKAVFLGNVSKTLFPYQTSSEPLNYADVLTNYTTTYSDARIVLPPVEFSTNTEYYWANVTFSDAAPNPAVLLQRIIGELRLHRNFVDANDAINQLVQNILIQIDYKNIIKTSLKGVASDHSDGILYKLLRPILVNRLTGLLVAVIDPLVNQLVLDLVDPIANALYDQILEALISQIELALAANATGNEGGLAYLGRILNPWAYGAEAIVTIDNFPKTIGFDLVVNDTYPTGQKFRYGLKTDTGGTMNERYVSIKGFNALYDVKKIDILAQGLVAGLVIDQVIGSDLLLPGVFMDITDPIVSAQPKGNLRYKADYSFVDLRLKSYVQQTDGNHNLTLTVKIGDIANINNVLAGTIATVKKLPVLGLVIGLLTDVIVNLILGDILKLTVSVPLNLPLLGVDNLTLSGSWSGVSNY